MLKLNDNQKRFVVDYLNWADETVDDPECDLIQVETSLDWYLLSSDDELPEGSTGYTANDKWFPYSIGVVKNGAYIEYDVITSDLAYQILQHA